MVALSRKRQIKKIGEGYIITVYVSINKFKLLIKLKKKIAQI